MERKLTEGSVGRNLIAFSIPYLIACFLQTFYGLADLLITGQYNGSDAIAAVAVGSQLMHMLTVMIAGLAMGVTVLLGRAVGASDERTCARGIGNALIAFAPVSVALAFALFLLRRPILTVLSTPQEAFAQAQAYAGICFVGIPLITAYNVLSSIFRGLGDTRRPLLFVFAAGVLNVALDFLLIGPMGMGARGAAIATVASQGASVVLALIWLRRCAGGVRLHRKDFAPDRAVLGEIFRVGLPICVQDGLIQISFLVITAIANARGVTISAAVGIVEKIISFLFLVPSAMLSTVAAICAQCAGAGLKARGRATLHRAIALCAGFGLCVFVASQFVAPSVLKLFAPGEADVVRFGSEYLRTYTLDCALAGIHFCFSGYFSACRKSTWSFVHNMISVVLVRIPGAALAAHLFPATLYPMGLAAPMGSLLSDAICLWLYRTRMESGKTAD